MHKERLIKLADLLEADALNPSGVKFDMTSWGAKSELVDLPGIARTMANENGRGFADNETVYVNCNTAACAFGLAAISGEFEGLSYEIHSGDLVPTYNGSKGWFAAEEFFAISEKQAYYLFDSTEYAGLQTKGAAGEINVAARIRAFVEKRR